MSDSILTKVILALISAGFGFAFAVILDWIKARREPKTELSWEAEISNSLVSVRQDIFAKVRVLYNEHQVSRLAVMKCRISNTGNRVVKEERVRFTFPKEVKILENFFDPKPERELGVAELEDAREESSERIYTIAHLESTMQVTFQFVLDGNVPADWSPHAFNEHGDVLFQKRDLSRVREDKEHLQPFLVIVLTLLLIPPVLRNLIVDLGDLAASGATLILLALLVPHIVPVTRLLTNLIANERHTDRKIHIKDANSVILGDHSAVRIHSSSIGKNEQEDKSVV
ncbi:hypothetical protein [Actinophytocola sp.]|uniref:hypothetical protein n=1 Tax=Actinophytocola sp. TaxID=1872138 RepID=UPI0038999A4A